MGEGIYVRDYVPKKYDWAREKKKKKKLFVKKNEKEFKISEK